ncbi:protein of unknown function [Candidatus Nitrosotalea okcheonensis]|uniref:Uncharacterized protein n=2 Tax=Candidatus Nitrosotalea okcheonensis TaxID=1903276 RepID=A0A2H1FFH3_9ARCH|nr:protein of unknown function [Candidatus Nitrosotalea okcheonensis]
MILLGMLTVPAFAQISVPKSLDHPGIKWDWKIKAENYTFDVITVSNYEMQNVTFNEMNKELVFLGNSTHDGNIAEIQIPTNLIGGKLTVTQDGKPVSSIVIPGTDSSTVMLKFNQTGTTNTSIIGTTYLPEFSNVALLVMVLSISMVLLIPRIKKF